MKADLLFVAASIFLIAVFQCLGWQYLALATPLAYTILSRCLLKVDWPVAAARTYMLCLLVSLIGLITHSNALAGELRSMIDDPDNAGLAIEQMAAIIPSILGPVSVGIATYTLCSVFEPQSPSEGNALSKLTEFIGKCDSPDEIKRFVIEVAEGLNSLSLNSKSAGQAIAILTSGLKETQSAIAVLAQDSKQWIAMSHELKELHTEIAQLRSSTREIAVLVDEFSQILEKKLLEY